MYLILNSIILIIVVLAINCVSLNIAVAKSNYCGALNVQSLDYRERSNWEANLKGLEDHHFTPEVENLIRGSTSVIGADLEFVLYRIPNHHRALTALAKLSIRDKVFRFEGLKYPVECYFDRAIRFRSSDGTVRMIYGGYLSKIGKVGQAIDQLKIAVLLEPDNAIAHYNLGILHFDKKDYSAARIHAEKAYALGFPLSGLKNKLKKVGK